MSTIVWTNQGQTSDGFAAVFGSNAALARSVIDADITSWEREIINFNYPGGGNTYDMTISTSVAGTGEGAGTVVNSYASNGAPETATITVLSGTDGHGGGYFLDPNPLASTAFTASPTNAYAAYAPAGSPASGKGDLYELVLHEMGHAMGFVPDADTEKYSFNTNVVDTADSALGGVSPPVGHYWAFKGPDGNLLVTDFNDLGNSQAQEESGPVHYSAPGASVTTGGITYYGSDDLLVPYYSSGQRRQISRDDLIFLEDSYGYTVQSPNYYGTAYDELDSTGELHINAPPTGGIAVSLTESGGNLTVNMTLGSPVAGADPSTITTTFAASAVTSVDIEGGSGNDAITLNPLGSSVPVTANGNGGTDTLTLTSVGTIATLNSTGITSSDCDVLTNGITNLIVDASSSSTLFSLVRQPVLGSGSVTFNGGAGDDSLYYGGLSVSSVPVTFNGGGGNNTVELTNSTLNLEFAYQLTDTALTESQPSFSQTVSLSSVTNFLVIGGSPSSTFSTSMANIADLVTLIGGAGNDSFTVADPTGLAGDYSITGGGGTDSLTVQNAGTFTTISSTGITTGGMSITPISGIANLVVNGSNVTGAFIVTGSPLSSSAPITINGGSGNDFLQYGYGDLIEAPAIAFNGEGGTNTVIVSNGNVTGNWVYSLTDGQLTSSTPGYSRTDTYTSVSDYTIVGGSGNDQFYTDMQNSSDAVSIAGGTGADTVQLDPDSSYQLVGAYSVYGGSTGASVFAIDSESSTSENYTVTSSGVSDALWSANVTDAGSLAVGMSGGTDTTNVSSLPNFALTLTEGAGTNTMNVGTGTHLLPSFNAGFTVNGGGANTLTLDDSSDTTTASAVATINATTFGIGSAKPMNYGGIGTFNYVGPVAINTINIIGNSLFTYYAVNAEYYATVNIGNGTLSNFTSSLFSQATITITECGLTNILDGSDPAVRSYTLSSNAISITGLPVIYDTRGENLMAGTGNDAISVVSTGIGSPVTVSGGGGNDNFYIGTPTGGGIAAEFAGSVTAVGGGGVDTLTYYDPGEDALSVTSAYLSPLFLGNPNSPYIPTYYSGISSLIVTHGDTGNGGSVAVASTAAGTPVTIEAAAGTEPITVTTTGTNAPVTIAPNAGSDPVTVGPTGTTTGTAVTDFAATQTIGALTVNTGGTAVVTASTSKVLTVTGLTFNGTGTLDLTRNDLIVHGGVIATVTADVASGFNLTGGGKWNGDGITSSAAATDTTHTTALGTIVNNNGNGTALFNSANPFDGIVPALNDILVKYTYYGDANLDGKVDGSDYSLIDNGFAADKANHGTGPLTGWYNGDFNYDKSIDGSDYSLIDNAFNNQGTHLVAPAAEPAAVVAIPTSTALLRTPAPIGIAPIVRPTAIVLAIFADTAIPTFSSSDFLAPLTKRFSRKPATATVEQTVFDPNATGIN